MAKVMVTDTHLTNIANAIRNKNNTSTTYKPSQMAAAINNISTGVDINGTVEQYQVAAGETISAGDFVRLVVDVNTQNPVEQFLNASFSVVRAVGSILLQDGRVLLFFLDNNSLLYCVLVTINGTTMTVNSTTQLTSSGIINGLANPILLNDGRVFVGEHVTTSTTTPQPRLAYHLLTINGNSVTVNKNGTFSETINTCYGNVREVLLPSGKILITYTATVSGVSKRLDCCLVTISGNNVTGVLSNIINTANSSVGACRLFPVNDTNVLIFRVVNTSSKFVLYATVVTINSSDQTSIIFHRNLTGTSNSLENYDVAKISSEEYFISIRYSTDSYLYFKKFFFRNNSPYFYSQDDKGLQGNNNYTGTSNIFYNLVLKDKKVCLIGCNGNGGNGGNDDDCYVGRSLDANIPSTVINFVTNMSKDNIPVNALVLPDGRIFSSCTGIYYNIRQPVGVILNTSTTVKRSSSTSSLHGVAVTGGTAGGTISVYVPN